MIIEVIRIQFDTFINKIWSFFLFSHLSFFSSLYFSSTNLTHTNRQQIVYIVYICVEYALDDIVKSQISSELEREIENERNKHTECGSISN